jgi:hypothetical protein
MILVSIQFQEHRCKIGAFQEVTITFGILPKIVPLQKCLLHIDHMGPNHKPKGLKGRPGSPTPWPADQTLSRFRPRLGSYIHTSVQRRMLCPRVGGNREEWPGSHPRGRLSSIAI